VVHVNFQPKKTKMLLGDGFAGAEIDCEVVNMRRTVSEV
jgi:hypothetical protein